MSWVRSSGNPILTRESIPRIAPDLVDATSVFNPGAVLRNGITELLLRVQSRGRRTHLLRASSPDGRRFRVAERLTEVVRLEAVGEPVHHVYDPRITEVDGRLYVFVAIDTESGCRLGLARTTDLETLELLPVTDANRRNGALFPE